MQAAKSVSDYDGSSLFIKAFIKGVWAKALPRSIESEKKKRHTRYRQNNLRVRVEYA